MSGGTEASGDSWVGGVGAREGAGGMMGGAGGRRGVFGGIGGGCEMGCGVVGIWWLSREILGRPQRGAVCRVCGCGEGGSGLWVGEEENEKPHFDG